MLAFVSPSPSVDVTYEVDELTLGEGHRPVSVHRNAGGKALNAARSASAMGAKVHATAVLAGHSGAFIAEQLQRHGVELHAIAGSTDTRSCISIASKGTGILTEVYEHASNVTGGEWEQVRAAMEEILLLKPSWVAASGSLPASLDPEALAQLVRECATLGVPFALDTHGAALAAAVQAKPALIKVNRAEARELLGCAATRDAAELAGDIHAMSAGMVIVTDGTEGAAATDGKRHWHIPPPERLGGFPVGSGDAFLGGLLSALDFGLNFSEALARGAGCSIANALQPGAASFNTDAAREIADSIRIVAS